MTCLVEWRISIIYILIASRLLLSSPAVNIPAEKNYLESGKIIRFILFFSCFKSERKETNVFLFIDLTTLGTLMNFNWLIHSDECSNISTTNFNLQKG